MNIYLAQFLLMLLLLPSAACDDQSSTPTTEDESAWLIPVSEVEGGWVGICTAIRNDLLALPGKIAPMLDGKSMADKARFYFG